MGRKNSDDIMRFLDRMVSSDDVLFGFLDEGNQSPEDFPDSGNFNGGAGDEEDDHDNDDDNCNCNSEENIVFWQEQEQLLQETLYRIGSIETKIRQATKEALKQVKSKGLHCVCRRPVADGCRSCLCGEISRHLRNVSDYDCVISKSKWRSSQDIPAEESMSSGVNLSFEGGGGSLSVSNPSSETTNKELRASDDSSDLGGTTNNGYYTSQDFTSHESESRAFNTTSHRT